MGRGGGGGCCWLLVFQIRKVFVDPPSVVSCLVLSFLFFLLLSWFHEWSFCGFFIYCTAIDRYFQWESWHLSPVDFFSTFRISPCSCHVDLLLSGSASVSVCVCVCVCVCVFV